MDKPEIIVKYSERSAFPDTKSALLWFDTEETDVPFLFENIQRCLTNASAKKFSDVNFIFYSGEHGPKYAVEEIANGIHFFIASNPRTSIRTITLAPDDRDMESLLRERVSYN